MDEGLPPRQGLLCTQTLTPDPSPVGEGRRAQKYPTVLPSDDHHGERQEAADDRHHDDVEIALAVGRIADREQRHHGAVVRQAVQRARADHRDPMQKSRVDALLMGDLEVGRAESIQRDGQASRG